MSIEALAMAGADCMECGIDLEVWEAGGSTQPPPHLLEEKILSSTEVGRQSYNDKKKMNEERVKAKIRQWAKAVVAMNRTALLLPSEFRNERCSLCNVSKLGCECIVD